MDPDEADVRHEEQMPPPTRRLGQRHLLVVLINLGITVLYAMRSNLSVALIAMVNDSAVVQPTNNASSHDDYCPLPVKPRSDDVDVDDSNAHQGPFPWPRSIQGQILSAFYWGYIVSQIPGGILAKRVGGKWVLAFGTAWAAVLTIVTPSIARLGPYYFIASRVVRGLVEGITYPAVNAMLGEWVPRSESTFLFIMANMGMQIGTIVGQLIAGPLCASSWGWESVFYLNGAIAVVWLVPWCLLVTSTPAQHPHISAEERQYIESSLTSPQSTEENGRNGRYIPWCSIFTDAAVWAYSFCTFVNSWKIYLLLTCMPQFLTDILHFDVKSDGLISTLPYVGNMFVQLFASHLADYIIASGRLSRSATRKVFTGLGQLSVAGFMVASVYIGCNAFATVAMLVCMLTFQGLDAGGFLPNALDLSPKFASVIFGFANTFGIGAGILAPEITDLITGEHTIHEWRLVFVVSAGVAASAALVFAVFGSGDQRDWLRVVKEDQKGVNDYVETTNEMA